jgi:molybdopterin molybdotransferase
MISLVEARKLVVGAIKTLAPARVLIENASDCVLAETVRAAESVPPFDNSAMDGYALRAVDTADPPSLLRVKGRVLAGDNPCLHLEPGECTRIMTGAALPSGADAVSPLEDVRPGPEGSVIVIDERIQPGTFVRLTGDDVSIGMEVFEPGTHLHSGHIGVLASLGIESVLVYPIPRVGVLSTGDELCRTEPLERGKIRDANRPALLAQLRSDGLSGIDLGIAADDEMQVASMLREAASHCDAVITSGGVSVGDRDVLKNVLAALSGDTMRWMQVAIRPAKPLAFGLLESTCTPVFGLPGNPVSALVSYELFVRPSLRVMAGHTALDRPRFTGIADSDLCRMPDGKLHLTRVSVSLTSAGQLRVRTVGRQASHMLRAMARSNALALVPDGHGIRAGEPVDVILLDVDDLSRSREG